MQDTFVLCLQVNLLRYKRLISKASDPEGLTRELRVCTEINCCQQEFAVHYQLHSHSWVRQLIMH